MKFTSLCIWITAVFNYDMLAHAYFLSNPYNMLLKYDDCNCNMFLSFSFFSLSILGVLCIFRILSVSFDIRTYP